MIKFIIPLSPMAKQSFKVSSLVIKTPTGMRFIRGYQPKEKVNWQTNCSLFLQSIKKELNLETILVPVFLKIVFFLPPKKRVTKKMVEKLKPETRPDLDNYEKMLNDACNRILFRDDSQITRKEVSKRYNWKTGEPFILFSIEEDTDEYYYLEDFKDLL